MAKGDVAKILCVDCSIPTNYEVIEEVKKSHQDDFGSIFWSYDFQVIQCRGCDVISFRQLFWSSDSFSPHTGDEVAVETLYPSRNFWRNPIIGYESFPARTIRVYLEVLTALNNNAPILAAIGLRAIIELICVEQNTTSNNLAGAINELAQVGLLSQNQAAYLHAHRFMGNVAAHEIVASTPQELMAALDIAETLLKTIYILPKVAASIQTGHRPSSTT